MKGFNILIVFKMIHIWFNIEWPVQCEMCSKQFRHNSTLKSHIRIHPGERPYECDMCSKRFKERSALKVLIKIHTGMCHESVNFHYKNSFCINKVSAICCVCSAAIILFVKMTLCRLVVVVGYPTPSEGWGHGGRPWSPEAGQLSRVWTRGRTETESRQRVSGAKSP